jgi:hypothetical protein
MPSIGKVDLVVLWGDELRTAAVLLTRARKMRAALGDSPSEADEQKSIDVTREAYEACEVALFGVDGDSAIVMIGSESLRDQKRRKDDQENPGS